MSQSKTRNFGDAIRRKLASDADLRDRVDTELFNIDVATLIYNARKGANLTQQQLANKVGTSQSVIARMEDSDYDGHSLKMLRRIAEALDCKLTVDLIDGNGTSAALHTPRSSVTQ